jgi:flagellar hook-basal body complex protein FliE
MTAPIGYPDRFGALLEQRRELAYSELSKTSEIGKTPELGKVSELGKPTPPAGIGPSFSEQLANFVSGIDQVQKDAKFQSEEFAVGRTNDIHNTMIDVEQADISLRMLANVRNRVVDLYREVMRMGS